MEVAVGVAVPVGLVRWADSPGRYTLVVKLTFELRPSGSVALAAVQQPLSTGASDAAGLLLEPCDFVEAKSECDVLVAGFPPNLEGLRLRVGPLDALMSPAVASASMDGACAPPEQRMPFPGFPLELELGVVGRSVTCTLSGPPPAAALLAAAHGLRTSIPLRADTLVVHLAKGLVCVSFRGTFQHAGDIERGALLVVAEGSRLASTPAGEIRLWPRQEVSEGAAPRLAPRSVRLPRSTISMSPVDRPVHASPRVPRSTVVMGSSAAGLTPVAPSQGFDDSALDPQPTLTMDLPLDLEPESSARPTLDLDSHPTLTMVLDSESASALPTMELVVHTASSLPSDPVPISLSPVLGPTANAGPLSPVLGPPASAPLPHPPPPNFAPTFGPKPTSAVPSLPPLTSQSTMEGAIGLDASGVLPFGMQEPPAQRPPSRPAPAQQVDRTMPISVADVRAHVAKNYGQALPFSDPPPLSVREPSDSKAPLLVVGGTPLAYPPMPFAPGRHAGEPPADDVDWDEEETFVALPQVSAPAAPTHPAPAASPAPRSAVVVPRAPVLASYQRGERQVAALQTAERSVTSGDSATGQRDVRRIDGLSLEEYTTLRGEIWSGLRPKREVLREHGLTSLKWRLVQQAWTKQIDAAAQDVDQAALLIASMRAGTP